MGIQLATARYLGRFLADPLEGVPTKVLDFLAGQLGIADPSCVKGYAVREQTHREHAARIRTVLGLRDFTQVEAELSAWVGTRAWVMGDGPKTIFAGALRWPRERDVLLPGVLRLDRAAYTFCVLEQFHRYLKRREIYAPASTR
jgi:Domain of unknown function (DUF4158)